MYLILIPNLSMILSSIWICGDVLTRLRLKPSCGFICLGNAGKFQAKESEYYSTWRETEREMVIISGRRGGGGCSWMGRLAEIFDALTTGVEGFPRPQKRGEQVERGEEQRGWRERVCVCVCVTLVPGKAEGCRINRLHAWDCPVMSPLGKRGTRGGERREREREESERVRERRPSG